VAELVEAALHAQVGEPVLAVLLACQCLSFYLRSGNLSIRTAAPPAMVPSRQLLISMTFLTV
jgi:hypothetical protein